MSFTESVKTCFNKYVTFKGRATRSEYWWFTLCATVLIILLPLLVFALFNAEAMLFAYAALVLAFYLPMWSVTVRRLHDTNHSGWWILCPVYPYILMFIKGSEGENNYGTGENQCQLPCPICSELVDANLKACPYCGEPTNFKLAEKNSGIDRKVAIGMLALCGLMLIGGIAFSFSDDSTEIGGGYDLSEYEDYDLEEAAEAEVVEEVEIDDIDYPEYSSSADDPDIDEELDGMEASFEELLNDVHELGWGPSVAKELNHYEYYIRASLNEKTDQMTPAQRQRFEEINKRTKVLYSELGYEGYF